MAGAGSGGSAGGFWLPLGGTHPREGPGPNLHPNPAPGLLPFKPHRVCPRQSRARGARLCCSKLKRGGGCALVLGSVGSLAGSSSHLGVSGCFFLGGGWEAKADFTPKTESAEKHRVLSFLPRESGKRIAISPLASAGRVGSAYYCGELKLSKRRIEGQRII